MVGGASAPTNCRRRHRGCHRSPASWPYKKDSAGGGARGRRLAELRPAMEHRWRGCRRHPARPRPAAARGWRGAGTRPAGPGAGSAGRCLRQRAVRRRRNRRRRHTTLSSSVTKPSWLRASSRISARSSGLTKRMLTTVRPSSSPTFSAAGTIAPKASRAMREPWRRTSALPIGSVSQVGLHRHARAGAARIAHRGRALVAGNRC